MLAAVWAVWLGAAGAAQDPHLLDRVEVERVTLDARVLDGRGDSFPNLRARDFRVKVDGRIVPVESVRWVAADAPVPEDAPDGSEAEAASPVDEPRGRLLVFFFQKDLHPSRGPGLLRMLHEAVALVDTLQPSDRVAVASFDSHLRLWADFTDDRETLRHAIERSVVFEGHEPWLAPGPFPSLAATMDRIAALDAASPETGLLVLGRALGGLPGAKSLVFFGWGMGSLTPGLGVRLEPDYGAAAAALIDARTTVFALDVTDADHHSLEYGLKRVAGDTGGFYARTHDFARTAMHRLRRALQGRYVLVFERPDLPRGTHRVEVDLVGVRGEVLARPIYVD